nr:MAG TPA: hypothetical protein [Caudoviricetes sp.]
MFCVTIVSTSFLVKYKPTPSRLQTLLISTLSL